MEDLKSFLLEATRCLCSSLNAEDSLSSFYSFIRKTIPVTNFRLSSTRPPYTETVRVANIYENLVDCQSKVMRISKEQEAFGNRIDAYNVNTYSELLLTDERENLYQFLKQFPGSDLKVPFLFMRLVRDNSIIGSAIFCSEFPFSQEQVNFLSGLEGPLCIALSNILQFRELTQLKEDLLRDNERLRRRLKGLHEVEVVGHKGGLREVMKRVSMAAPVDVPVLITGETGTGKEVIAKAVHEMSSRKRGPFVAVNCGAISPSLLDSELFGHVKGAFTGAHESRKGRFERADGGTLFLDEIGELPQDAQARLLRVLENREVDKVGGGTPIKVDIRIIAATNRDLSRMVREGAFREDLYYRLKVVSIVMPPLRERKQDIPELVGFLLRRSATRYGMLPPRLLPNEMEQLMHYDWPGNVRELQNTLEEALVCSSGLPLRFSLGVAYSAPDAATTGTLADMNGTMREYFLRCLKACHGKVDGPGGAAQISGLTPSTFRFRCKKLGIVPRQVM